MRTIGATAVLILALVAAAGRAQEAPFPAGTSSQELEGLKCSIVMPAQFDPAKERSMLVGLHGAGGTETGMAGSLQHLAADDFVIVAPKSRGDTWAAQDLEDVKRIVARLKTELRVGAGRLHAAGFSNGGWNLAPVALDEDLHFVSACWIAAGFKGGKFPRHAQKEMGVLALAGASDANRSAAEATPDLVEGKVRSAAVRIEKGKGHEWTPGLMPFYRWWLFVQEGRFVPGETLAFDWEDLPDGPGSAGTQAAAADKGLFVYWYRAADKDSEDARALQNDVMLDPLVFRYGRQLTAVKASADDHAEAFAALKLKETPAIAVYDDKGKLRKVVSGTVKASALAAALRSVAADKSKPK